MMHEKVVGRLRMGLSAWRKQPWFFPSVGGLLLVPVLLCCLSPVLFIASIFGSPDPGDLKTLSLPGGDQLRLRWCPPGRFIMGSTRDEPQLTDVTLTEGFWMAETEVTQEQFEAVMGRNPSRHEGEDLPVTMVSQLDAIAFCKSLTETTGATVALPSEAQWEYACRAGSDTFFHFGDDASKRQDYDHVSYETGSTTTGGLRSHRFTEPLPVASKRPNAWRIYDVHGNVSEWTSSYWSDRHPGGEVTDPTGPRSANFVVYKGGDYGSFTGASRSAYRWKAFSDSRQDYIGFRVIVLED